MARYLIHAVPSRMWYVNDYLIPSMIEQGINKDHIRVYCDNEHNGNLRAWINSMEMLDNTHDGTWHLQDDVCISTNFKTTTEAVDFGIVCGFKSRYDGDTPYGACTIDKMWFSFPCIRLPNKIAKDCVHWIDRYMVGNKIYKKFWETGTNDDWFTRNYLFKYHSKECCINLNPNIVDHVDYLIGGTVNSKARKIAIIRSELWKDEEAINKLERALKNELGHERQKDD